jgi:FkbM family methyltransferase
VDTTIPEVLDRPVRGDAHDLTTMDHRPRFARVPVALEFPDEMSGVVGSVLAGEYESGYFGRNLTILDVGANVGSFAIWANLRWPNSTIHAYEPHPSTFQMLIRNVGHYPNVACHRTAVFPSDKKEDLFFSRYPGDGEAGLVTHIDRFFDNVSIDKTVLVPLIHPKDLPRCDILKIDAEGAEAAILSNLGVTDISLILLEYHDLQSRRVIEDRLKTDFVLEYEDRYPWSDVLPRPHYRKELAGDYYGHLFFIGRRRSRLTRLEHEPLDARSLHALSVDGPSFKRLVAALPGAAKCAVEKRLRKLRQRLSIGGRHP